MEGVYGGSIGGGEMKVFCSLCDAEKASPPSATEAGELARRAWADVLTKHRVYVGSNTALGGPILEARDAAIASLLQKLEETEKRLAEWVAAQQTLEAAAQRGAPLYEMRTAQRRVDEAIHQLYRHALQGE